MATEFSTKVIALIQKIPPGKVATYGQIASLAGKPQGARGVSWILHSSSKAKRLPWHRVLGAGGKIAFPKSSRHFLEQRRRLAQEGVGLLENGKVDLVKNGWKKRRPKNNTATARLVPRAFS